MKLLVLGGTGPTGLHVVREAAERGHEVIVFCRAPEKVNVDHVRVKAVKGDIMSVTDLAEQMSGCDAVMSALGTKGGVFTPVSLYSDTIKVIVKAMKKAGVKRLVAVTAWGTKDDPRLPFLWRWVFQPTFLRHIFHDMRIMEDYLTNKECDFVDYTIVRPPMLTNAPSEGGQVQEVEGQLVVGPTYKISRQDVAIYMLQTLDSDFYNKKMMAINEPDKS